MIEKLPEYRGILTVVLALVGIDFFFLRRSILVLILKCQGMVYTGSVLAAGTLGKDTTCITLLPTGVEGKSFLLSFHEMKDVYCPYYLTFAAFVIPPSVEKGRSRSVSVGRIFAAWQRSDAPRQVSQSHKHNKHYYADSNKGPIPLIFKVYRCGEYSTKKQSWRGKRSNNRPYVSAYHPREGGLFMNQTSTVPRPHLHSFVSSGKGGRKNASTTPLKSRRVDRILREGLVSATGHHVEAMILQSFLYWTGRLWDFDQFMYEERMCGKRDIQGEPPESGWVEKTTDDLLKELAFPGSRHAIRRCLKSLVRKGFLYEREDPVYPWEHTLQYRVNLVRLQKALARRGYSLDEGVFG